MGQLDNLVWIVKKEYPGFTKNIPKLVEAGIFKRIFSMGSIHGKLVSALVKWHL